MNTLKCCTYRVPSDQHNSLLRPPRQCTLPGSCLSGHKRGHPRHPLIVYVKMTLKSICFDWISLWHLIAVSAFFVILCHCTTEKASQKESLSIWKVPCLNITE